MENNRKPLILTGPVRSNQSLIGANIALGFGNPTEVRKGLNQNINGVDSSLEVQKGDKANFPGTKASDVEGTDKHWVTIRGRKVLVGRS